jgi:hypothetical protein
VINNVLKQELKGMETIGTANSYADVHKKLMGKNHIFFLQQDSD